jgi:hypothetical protein
MKLNAHWRKLFLGIFILAVTMPLTFQNCSRVSHRAGRSTQPSESTTAFNNNGGHPYDGKPKNCKEVLDLGLSTGSGFYTIWPTPTTPVKCFCDMSSDGGGWTLVVNQPRAKMYGMPVRDGIDLSVHGKLDYPIISALLAGSSVTASNNIRVLVELSSDSYTNGVTPIPASPETYSAYLNSNGFSGSGAYYPQVNYPGDCSGDPGLQNAAYSPVTNYWFFGTGYGYGVAYSEGRNPINAQNPFYRVPWTDLDGFYLDASGPGLSPCQGRIVNGTRSIGLKGSVWIR